MYQQLIIAEKPSLAKDICMALGGIVRSTKDFTEVSGGSVVVSSAFGHLFEQVPPEAYNPAYSEWSFEHLPIVPSKWELDCKPDARARFNVLCTLAKQSSMIVHGGDADREGQLLIEEILHKMGWTGPVKRLWLHKQTKDGIREAYAKMKDNAAYRGTFLAAQARSQSDWLIGMNGTRAMTLANRNAGNGGKRGLMTVGRVQTPTLAMVVDRNRKIANFVPVDYFTISATAVPVKPPITAFSMAWQAGPNTPDLDADRRLVSEATAKKIVTRLSGKGEVTKATATPVSSAPPLCYMLVKLQAAAGRLGFSPAKTLKLAQSLYETHKIISYPRGAGQHLPEEEHRNAAKTLAAIAHHCPDLKEITGKADPSIKSPTWSDKEVAKASHYAIMPLSNTVEPSLLSKDERAIYRMVSLLYIAQFFPNFNYLQQSIEAVINDEKLKANGRYVTRIGWKEVFGAEAADDSNEAEETAQALPALKQGDALMISDARIKKTKTKPPPYFTEASLALAMSNVASIVTDPGVRGLLSDADGIGTAATRGDIIEGLIRHELLVLSGTGKASKLLHTPKADQLIDSVPPFIKDVALTAVFERAMNGIETGDEKIDTFQASMVELVTRMVNLAKKSQIQKYDPDAVQKPTAAPRKRKDA